MSELQGSGNRHYDVVVCGAGFAGLYMLYRARELGFTVRAFERGEGAGGTWFWNRYPGARCDVESVQYSYSFSNELQQHWSWSERFAPQPEILKYINHVVDRFDLRRDIQFNTSVVSASFDEGTSRWMVALGDGTRVTASFVVSAMGCLSTANMPDFKGVARFRGKTYHTGRWPHDGVDFTGLRVAVIGTGSSGIQAIPVIAGQAKHLTVFQRTPSFSIPARNAVLSEQERQFWKKDYRELRRRQREESPVGVVRHMPSKPTFEVSDEQRAATYEKFWQEGGTTLMTAYTDLMVNEKANDTAADFVRGKIAEIVRDPKVAKILQPTSYPIGTKRLCLDTQYYETYNRSNVTLVDVREAPITEITETGLVAGGKDYEFDMIVFATGFDAVTGALSKVDVRGRGGRLLNDKWALGPKTYLGLMVAGFPNLFIVTGPGSPSVISNMIVSIEQHVEWIGDCLNHLRRNKLAAIEAKQSAEDEWSAHVTDIASRTLFPRANSWYTGANIAGKVRAFYPYIAGTNVYRKKCDDVAAKGYEGFELKQAQRPTSSAAE